MDDPKKPMPKTKMQQFDEESGKSRALANHLLLSWLSDDKQRESLYQEMRAARRPLQFQSRADAHDGEKVEITPLFHQESYLVVDPEQVAKVLSDGDQFDSSPYRALGTGTFMLGLDVGAADLERQIAFAKEFLKVDPLMIEALAAAAFKTAAVLPLQSESFDLAGLAEEAALWFVGFLFGFAEADHLTLQTAARAAYRALNYQIIGRHFATEPATKEDGNEQLAGLFQRVAALIDLYARPIGRDDSDELATIDGELADLNAFEIRPGKKPLNGLEPILRRIAKASYPDGRQYSLNEAAVIVAGVIAGIVGNVQAGVCIAMQEFLSGSIGEFAQGAVKASILGDLQARERIEDSLKQALLRNPPAAFLARRAKEDCELGSQDIKAGELLLVAVGGATSAGFTRGEPWPDSLVFGGPEPKFAHRCLGERLAMPLMLEIVTEVLSLPGLSQVLDPRTGDPKPLQKTWGVICDEFPLRFTREKILIQYPLIVAMNVKKPIPQHAEALRLVIKYGAPRIQLKLSQSGIVHFAEFLFVENDSKLILFTVYDRDFDSYIAHFALKIGSLFDLLFEHLEDAPPSPVSKFPQEFVDTIRRYNVAPVCGYLFSAYPTADAGRIALQYGSESA